MTNVEIISQIKTLASDMLDHTSVNDSDHAKLADIIALSDELLKRCTDDGR